MIVLWVSYSLVDGFHALEKEEQTNVNKFQILIQHHRAFVSNFQMPSKVCSSQVSFQVLGEEQDCIEVFMGSCYILLMNFLPFFWARVKNIYTKIQMCKKNKKVSFIFYNWSYLALEFSLPLSSKK